MIERITNEASQYEIPNKSHLCKKLVVYEGNVPISIDTSPTHHLRVVENSCVYSILFLFRSPKASLVLDADSNAADLIES